MANMFEKCATEREVELKKVEKKIVSNEAMEEKSTTLSLSPTVSNKKVFKMMTLQRDTTCRNLSTRVDRSMSKRCSDDMEGNLTVHSSNLIESLDTRPNEMREDNPFYWYFRLESLGKRIQTKEMVDEAISNFSVDNNLYTILKVISKKYLTREVCMTAVSKNGLNLKYVPMQYRDVDMCFISVQSNGGALKEIPEQILLGEKGYELCLTAVSNDFEGNALSFVPDCYLRGEKGRELCKVAVRSNGYSFEYIPMCLKTKEFAKLAVEAPFPVRDVVLPDGSYSTQRAYLAYRPILSIIPEKIVSQELVNAAVRLHPENIRYAPPEFVSRDLCFEIVEQNPTNLRYMPFFSKELVNYAMNLNPRAILCVPQSLLTFKLCRDALRKDPTISIERFPEAIRKKLEKEFHADAVIKYEPIALETPISTVCAEQMISVVDKAHTYDLSISDGSVDTIYYVTDIHLEHQLVKAPNEIMKLSLPEIKRLIKSKISEFVASVPDITGTLLIGGDVADSVELESAFYEQLAAFDGWRGRIIAILGNHELWDGDPRGVKPARSVDEIISSYRQALPSRIKLLENELFIMYKGFRSTVLDEPTILNARVEELTKACADSTFILLGGIGFSGLNPIYNAKMGLYRAAVSTEEDIERSNRFKALYDKVLSCAGDFRVIVLTHMQMADWSDARYNPNWIYVSGHTHQNTFLLREDGTAVFSDNQIGYKPKPWYLNSFSLDVHKYDPFESFSDGIHRITREQYVEFNRCQGIEMQSMKCLGDLYALKRNGVYMFVIETDSSLCLLEGGRRHRLDYDISYYYNNLPEYLRKVRGAFAPYQKALSMISDEVKAIGGTGAIHGCIVDIDWFNHVYLNPFDGKVTPYFALDMTNKLIFEDMKSMFESSPVPPQLVDGSSMIVRYSKLAKEMKLPILSRNSNQKWERITIPQIVLDRSMYDPSRVMRSVQYIFDQNVLRVWNDAILVIEDNNEPKALIGD